MELQQNPEGEQKPAAAPQTKPATPALSELFTAKPSRAIVGFKEGKVEMRLRKANVGIGLITLCVASATLYYYNKIAAAYVSQYDPFSGTSRIVSASSVCGAVCNRKPIDFLLGTAIMIMIYETLAIVLRYLNIRLIITFSTISSIMDIIANALLTLFVLIGGCLFLSDMVSILKATSIEYFFKGFPLELVVTRCLLMFEGSIMLLTMIAMTVWTFLFLVKKWNAKLVEQLEEEGMEA